MIRTWTNVRHAMAAQSPPSTRSPSALRRRRPWLSPSTGPQRLACHRALGRGGLVSPQSVDRTHLTGRFAEHAEAWINGDWEPTEAEGWQPANVDDLVVIAEWDSIHGVTSRIRRHELGEAARDYLPSLIVKSFTYTRETPTAPGAATSSPSQPPASRSPKNTPSTASRIATVIAGASPMNSTWRRTCAGVTSISTSEGYEGRPT